MKSRTDRRTFLKATSMAIPTALVLDSIPAIGQSLESQGTFEATYRMLVQRGALMRLGESGEVQHATPWAISAEDQDLLPYIVGQKMVTIQSEPTELSLGASKTSLTGGQSTRSRKVHNFEDSAIAGIVQDPGYSEFEKRLDEFRLLGELPTADIISDVGAARYRGQDLKIDFIAFDDLKNKTGADAKIQSNLNVLTLTYADSAPIIPAPALDGYPTQESLRISRTGFGYKVQFRGPDRGGLIGCAPEAPRHYHLELFRQNRRGGYDYLANFHVAIWWANGRICFALANNYGSPRCVRRCTPTFSEVKNAFQGAFRSVGVPLVIAAALAALLAAVVYGSIFVLAV